MWGKSCINADRTFFNIGKTANIAFRAGFGRKADFFGRHTVP
jgi:hypothetical protein